MPSDAPDEVGVVQDEEDPDESELRVFRVLRDHDQGEISDLCELLHVLVALGDVIVVLGGHGVAAEDRGVSVLRVETAVDPALVGSHLTLKVSRLKRLIARYAD